MSVSLGPLLAVWLAAGSPVEREMRVDRARVAEVQRCLAAEQRARTRRDPAAALDPWPFAQLPLDVEQDAARCGMRGGTR